MSLKSNPKTLVHLWKLTFDITANAKTYHSSLITHNYLLLSQT